MAGAERPANEMDDKHTGEGAVTLPCRGAAQTGTCPEQRLKRGRTFPKCCGWVCGERCEGGGMGPSSRVAQLR